MFSSPLAVYGIPRSGFSLTISTLYKLGLFDKKQLSILNNIDKDLGELIFKPITNILEKNVEDEITLSGEFNSLTGGPKQLVQNKLWIRKYIGLGELGDITLSIKVPKIFCILCPIYHSHSPDNSISFRSHNIFTYRHPCGIYESSINSFNALTSKYLQKFSNTLDAEEKLRRQLALDKLCSDNIRNSMLNYLEENMMNYTDIREKNEQQIYDISWEGFLSNNKSNIENIKKILFKFGIDKSYEEIIYIIESSKYKNLLTYHKHNFRPGHALITGWVTELPYQVTKEIKELKSYKNYTEIINRIYKKNLKLSENSLASSKFKKLASSILKNKINFQANIDPLLKEYALNKTNVDQNSFKDTHIINRDFGFIYIHRMSKSCEKFIRVFKEFSNNLEKINEMIENSVKNLDLKSLYQYYPDLKNPIKLALDLKDETSRVIK